MPTQSLLSNSTIQEKKGFLFSGFGKAEDLALQNILSNGGTAF